KVTHVSIEHARVAAAPTAAKSAPREFRVTGWTQDPAGTINSYGDGSSRTAGGSATRSRERQGGGGEEGELENDNATLRPYVLVERGEYLIGEDDQYSVQTFAVSDKIFDVAPPVGWVTLEMTSNHGGVWTCLYGFRVHGVAVKG
ncbi:unnamed protein product, partial [Sphacelaria rigidula]